MDEGRSGNSSIRRSSRRQHTPIVNYIEDAEREGDTELVEFFKEVQEHDAKRGQETRLGSQLPSGPDKLSKIAETKTTRG